MSETLPKSSKLLKSKDFNRLKSGSTYISSKFVYAFVKPNPLNRGRLGITASRKTGNAVMRNKLKRAVRESFRKCNFKSLPFDIVILARPGLKKSLSSSHVNLNSDIANLLNKAISQFS